MAKNKDIHDEWIEDYARELRHQHQHGMMPTGYVEGDKSVVEKTRREKWERWAYSGRKEK